MTKKILHKIELVDDPTCLWCGSEDSLTHALDIGIHILEGNVKRVTRFFNLRYILLKCLY